MMHRYEASYSARESRLLHEAGSMQVLEILKEKSYDTNEQLVQLRDKIGNTKEETPEQLQIKETVQSLDPKVRTIIDGNLRRLEEAKSIFVARKDIASLRNSIDEINRKENPTIKQQAEDAVAKTGNFVGETKEQFLNSKVGKFFTSIKDDFNKGSNLTKAGYIIGGVFGFMAARWAWRKTFGTPEKEGLVQKTSKWILSILGAVGMVKLVQYLQNKYPTVPKAIEGGATAVTEGVGKAKNKIVENYQESFGVIAPEQFKTEAEYVKALENYLENNKVPLPVDKADREAYKTEVEKLYLETMQKKGFTIASFGNTLYFIAKNGVSTVLQSGSLFTSGIKLLALRDLESGLAFGTIWIEGSALYASSFGVVDFARLTATVGPKAGFARAALNSAGWPFELLMKGGRTIGMLSETGRFKISTQVAMLKENFYSHPKYLSKVLKLSPFRQGIELRCIENFRAWEINHTLAENSKALKMNHELCEIRKLEALRRLAKDLTILAQDGQIPAFIEEAPGARNILQQIKAGSINLKNLEKVLVGATEAKAAAETVSVGAKAAEAATVAKEADAVADVAKTGDEAAEVASKGKYMKGILDRLKIPGTKFMEAIKSAKFPPQIVELFTKTRAGTYFLVETFAKAGAPAMNYLSKLTKILPYAKVAAGPLSIVGLEALCLGLETSSINAEIAKTDSKEIKDLLETQKTIAKGSAVLGTASGLAISAGSKLALPLLPVWLTYQGASATRRSFEKETIEWMKSDKDMLQSTPAELRGKLRNIDPGKQNYAQQNAARGNNQYKGTANVFGGSLLEQVTGLGDGEQKFKTVEKTNQSQRNTLTRAYLVSMSELAPNENETESQYKERTAKFLLAQEQYMANVTGNTFAIASVDTYYAASEHAELKEIAEAIKGGNQEINPYIQLYAKDGTGKIVKGEEFDLAEYLDLPANNQPNKDGVNRGDVLFSYQQNKRVMTVAMALLAKETQSGAALDTETLRLMFKDRMVTDLRHEIARLDEKLAIADLKGWEWTGGEDATRNAVRFAIYKDFKRAVDQEAIALEKKPSAGIDDMNAAIERLQTYLDQNIEHFVKLADRPDLKAVYAEFTAKGADPAKLLDWRVIRQDMQSSVNAPAKNPQMDQKAFENAQKKAA